MNDNAFWQEGQAVDNYFNNTVDAAPTLTVDEVLVGGVMQVRLNWTACTVYISDNAYPLAAGTITLNTADVAAPTSYYVWCEIIGGAPVVKSSATNPETDPTLPYNYAWVSFVRFKSVTGTATVYYVRRAYCATEQLAYHIGEWDLARVPQWIDGGGITINATTGVVNMVDLLDYRRLRFSGKINPITAGVLMLADETTTHANLETVTTYVDGSPITAGKYHKMLLGVITSISPEYPFVLIRQGLPPSGEYATLAAAVSDADNVAAVSFPVGYRGMVFPLAYIAMKLSDASDLQTIDLRSTGITGGGGGGGSAIADHSLLINLGADDHPQYTRTDATRTFVAQTANRVLAGPATGAAAAPMFRALVAADIPSNVAVMPYAMASDSTTQSIANIANAQVITFNTSELLSGITRTSSSRYTIITAGTYLIALSAIYNLAQTPGDKHIELWMRVDGVDVPRSNTRVHIVDVNVAATLAVTLLYTFTAGQYFEIWTWGDDTDCQWLATAAGALPTRPAVPSVIMTVNMVSA